MDKTFELMLNVFLLTSTHKPFPSIWALTFFNLTDLSSVGCMFSSVDISKKGNKENEFQASKCQVQFKSQSICHPNGESTKLTTMTVVTFWESKTRGVSHSGLAIYIKRYLKAKEELWKLKYPTMQKYNLQKIL